jgi:hypothetical protein
MRNIVLGLAAATALAGAACVPATEAQAAPLPGVVIGVDTPNTATIEKTQVFIYSGRHFCWYDDAWNGPGWYWCGYGWRRGFGWGGPWGFRGWGYGYHSYGEWRGHGFGGYRGGYVGHGGYGGGHWGGAHVGGGGHWGGGHGGGGHGGGHGGHHH